MRTRSSGLRSGSAAWAPSPRLKTKNLPADREKPVVIITGASSPASDARGSHQGNPSLDPEWLETAKSCADYSNRAGQYVDLLQFFEKKC